MSIVSLFSVSSLRAESTESCLSTREYVTTYNYLSHKKEFEIRPDQLAKVANEVSLNCTGAANSFIQIVDILTKAEVTTSDAIRTGIKFSKMKPEVVDAFRKIFKMSFKKNQLNLDLTTSLELSLNLSLHFKGVQKHALKDFSKMVRFCISESNLDLPRPQCARFASDVALLGQNFEAEIATSFLNSYKFLTTAKGPNLSTYKALDISKRVSAFGPFSSDNFIQGYNFGISKKGLNLGEVKAMKFAVNMAERSIKK